MTMHDHAPGSDALFSDSAFSQEALTEHERKILEQLNRLQQSVVYYRHLIPRIEISRQFDTYYSIYDEYAVVYFLHERDAVQAYTRAETYLLDNIESLSQVLEHTGNNDLLERYENLRRHDVQTHKGPVNMYTIHRTVVTDNETVEQKHVTVDPNILLRFLSGIYDTLVQDERLMLEFFGIEYLEVQHSSENVKVLHALPRHVSHAPAFQTAIKLYREVMKSGQYETFLAFLFAKAGMVIDDIHAVHARMSESKVVYYYLVQHAVRIWYLHWKHDVQDAIDPDAPLAWHDEMLDYHRIVSIVLMHGDYVHRMFDASKLMPYRQHSGAYRYSFVKTQTIM